MTRVRLESAGGVGRVTLARTGAANALDRQTAVEIANGVKRLDADGSVRVVLLDAEGEDFCLGAGVAPPSTRSPSPASEQRRVALDEAQAVGRLFVTLRAMMKPVVAAVDGRALDAGAGLATACDVVLASARACFGYPAARHGSVPALVLPALRRSVGEKRAAELVLTGRVVSAAEALELGLVSRVHAGTGFAAAATAVAQEMADAPEMALALTKRLLYHLDELAFREGIAAGVKMSVEAAAAPA